MAVHIYLSRKTKVEELAEVVEEVQANVVRGSAATCRRIGNCISDSPSLSAPLS